MRKRTYQQIERDVLAVFHGCRPEADLFRLNAELEGNLGPVFGRRRRTVESAALCLPVDAGRPQDVLARNPGLFDGVFAERLAECHTAHERAVEMLWQKNLHGAYARAPKTVFQPPFRLPPLPKDYDRWPRSFGDTAIRVPAPTREEYGTAPAWADEQEPVKAALRAMGANVP